MRPTQAFLVLATLNGYEISLNYNSVKVTRGEDIIFMPPHLKRGKYSAIEKIALYEENFSKVATAILNDMKSRK